MKTDGTSTKRDHDDQAPGPAPETTRQEPPPRVRREARVEFDERTPEEAGYGYGV